MAAAVAFNIGNVLPPHSQFRTTFIRATPCCSQMPTGGRKPSRSEREAEIAAKIDQLRRLKKLQSQAAARDSTGTTNVGGEDALFSTDIQEGEALFGTSPTKKEIGGPDKYRPRVSTWGVFPRPDNISRAYGGGRKLPLGGGKEQSAEEREKDARIKRKLAQYLGGSVAEAEHEAEHAEKIENALKNAKAAMAAGQAFEATQMLRNVLDFATVRSQRGGEIRLALALAYEETGRRSEARLIYAELIRLNRFTEVKRTAKRLSAGFEAMQKLRVNEGMGDGSLGFRSMDFVIPDIAAMCEKRYATVLGGSDGVTENEAGATSGKGAGLAFVVLLVLAGIPALVIVYLQSKF